MITKAIKTEVEKYLPLLSAKQQTLVLEMIKSLLNVNSDTKKITRKQYNQQLNDALERIEKGNAVSHTAAENELSKWCRKSHLRLFGTEKHLMSLKKY